MVLIVIHCNNADTFIFVHLVLGDKFNTNESEDD